MSKNVQVVFDSCDGGDVAIISVDGGMSARGIQFLEFVEDVLDHIENYTVEQYGDYPNDQMTNATPEEILHNMTRYINRAKTNARGPVEADRDILKMAHYACILRLRIKQIETEKLAEKVVEPIGKYPAGTPGHLTSNWHPEDEGHG